MIDGRIDAAEYFAAGRMRQARDRTHKRSFNRNIIKGIRRLLRCSVIELYVQQPFCT
jgi:hypothetical protein